MTFTFDLVLQAVLAEKENGLQKLNAAVEAGEKLYPDTASAGRELIRQQLREAKELWDNIQVGFLFMPAFTK